MKRTLFYKTQTHIRKIKGVTTRTKELDPLYIPLSNLKIAGDVGYYRVKEEDVMQPDLISFKVYCTEVYWWAICVLNNIQNPLRDIQEGALLKIPSVYSFYDFYQKYGQK